VYRGTGVVQLSRCIGGLQGHRCSGLVQIYRCTVVLGYSVTVCYRGTGEQEMHRVTLIQN
jgi:hypothetical protein